MCRASFSRDEHTHGSFRAGCQPTIGRLPIYQEPALAREWMLVCRLRTMTTELFVNREEQSNAIHTITAQTFRCQDLRRDDPLCITRSTAIDEFIVLTRREERRHRIHVRREHNASRRFSSGKHIEPIRTDLLFLNTILKTFEILRKILAHRQLFTSNRRNINQLPRQFKNTHSAYVLFVLYVPFCGYSSCLWLFVAKNSSCSLVTTSRTRSSLTTKVKLILEAPCEIKDTLISVIVLNARAATPGVPRKPSPTTQMIACPFSTFTVPSCSSSSTISGKAPASSNDSDTLTSAVVTTSITVRCRSKTSKSARKKPYAPSIRNEEI